ncbi:MAG: CoA transferase [Chloroflexi bacterium]|nr:CoA transferase [Chloroflexota bacterium]
MYEHPLRACAVTGRGGLPLEGVRILDLTQMLAGPYATRLLADLGAEMIKIESRQRYDLTRGPVGGDRVSRAYPNDDPGEHPWNRSHFFNELNRNKLGITLSLTHPRGVELFKALVRASDAVIENFSARVMQNLGLSYQVLREVKPQIVMCSMPALGMTGPEKDYVCYGTTMEMLSGMTELMGYSDGVPMMTGLTYGDTVAGTHAAFAVVAALRHRRRTGEGQYIDLSQLETITQYLGPHILEYSMQRRQPARLGNRHPTMAPHGIYPTREEERWVSVAVGNDAEWQALGRAMGKPELADDPRYATLGERYQRQNEIDPIIAAWTAPQSAYQVQETLQQSGVAAGVVATMETACTQDPHLAARDYFQTVTHPEAGTHLAPSAPWKLEGYRLPIRKPAPLLGEDNQWVLGDILGLTLAELRELEEAGVVGALPAELAAAPKP